jgi:hypothetical protein
MSPLVDAGVAIRAFALAIGYAQQWDVFDGWFTWRPRASPPSRTRPLPVLPAAILVDSAGDRLPV